MPYPLVGVVEVTWTLEMLGNQR